MGYDVKYLLKELRYILGLDRQWGVIVIGAGHLGLAMAQYSGFEKRGFVVRAIFDADKAKCSRIGEAIPVMHASEMAEFIKNNEIEIAMITVPAAAAQQVCDDLCEAGIKAILNFAPIALNCDDSVRCLSVDLTTKLEAIAYYMSFSKDKLWKVV